MHLHCPRRLLSTFFARGINSVKTALVEHAFELMFDAVFVQVVHETSRCSRGFSRLELLLGKVLHVPVFGAVVSVDHTKELSFGSSVADSATPLLHVTSAVQLRHKVDFDRTE